MPAPLIPIIAGAAKVAAGTFGRAAVGQAAKTAASNGNLLPSAVCRLPSLTGRTASGKTLQATKPRKQWDWSNMAGNFTASNDGEFV